MEYSVLMSVYYKEKAIFLKESIDSIINQSVPTNDFVIVCDGKLTEELDKLLLEYSRKYNFINIVRLDKNQGLGRALSIGLKHCKNELVGRMDSDDISTKDRFKKQLNAIEQNPNSIVVGGYIEEFYISVGDMNLIRKVPLDNDEIVTMCKKRNPMNHVTVMFKKSKIEKVGGYMHMPYLEDYYLWLRLIVENNILLNIPEVLVNVRTGKDMYKRRGNKEQIKGWYQLQNIMNKHKMVSKFDVIIHMLEITAFVYTPSKLKELTYKVFLRKRDFHE